MKKIIFEIYKKITISINEWNSKKEIRKIIKSLKPYKTEVPLIRMGSDGDGGYLLPDDLKGINQCFSPGVGLLSDFELDCTKLGMAVFMADGSVDGPVVNNDRFHFTKKYLGHKTDNDFMTYDEWFHEHYDKNGDVILQMDIEGGEYEILKYIPKKTLLLNRVILIELHWLDRLWNRDFRVNFNENMKDIIENYVCVHIHPNNCCGNYYKYKIGIPRVAEFTFIRKDRVSIKNAVTEFPHKLDRDNLDTKSIVLPKNWFT